MISRPKIWNVLAFHEFGMLFIRHDSFGRTIAWALQATLGVHVRVLVSWKRWFARVRSKWSSPHSTTISYRHEMSYRSCEWLVFSIPSQCHGLSLYKSPTSRCKSEGKSTIFLSESSTPLLCSVANTVNEVSHIKSPPNKTELQVL